MTLGQSFEIVNNSTGSVTVNSSGGNAVQVLTAGTTARITNILTSGTSAASWSSTLYSPLTLTSTLTITGSSAGFVAFAGVSTEAGAAAGPIYELYRNSASPAANDILGQVIFYGGDSTPTKQEYGSIEAVIQTATSGSEDGVLDFYATRAGSRTRIMSVGANIIATRGLIQGYTTTATAAGTTTLTVNSTQQQFFTGSTTQTVQMPVTSTLTLGQAFEIVNNSTGAVTINSSGSNAIAILPTGTAVSVVCILTSGTSAASWSVVTPVAASLRSATTVVGVAAATAPSSGQVLTATSSTAATWQTISAGLTLGTDTATTSGNTITFSSIPSGVKQITLSWRGGSTNNIGQIYVQIGDSGGLETTGYTGDTLTFGTTPTISRTAWSAGSGALLANYTNAATVWNATLVATLVNAATNTWSFSVTSTNDAGSGTAPGTIGAGNKSLSATLDRIAIITANTFDAGSVNIAYSS
jgi:sarcosine oxidase gamma subunit